MKRFEIICIIMLFLTSVNAQNWKGVMLKNASGYHKGDTVVLTGHFPNGNNQQERFLTGREGDTKEIYPGYVSVIERTGDFWKDIWFYYRSGEVVSRGWQNTIRDRLSAEGNNFLQQINNDNLIFKDDLLTDYLNEMLHRISPGMIPKQKPVDLKVFVFKSNDSKVYSFDDGTIFLSTSFLLLQKTETDLIQSLTKELAHLDLDHQMLNLRHEIAKEKGEAVLGAIIVVTAAALVASSTQNGYVDYTVNDAPVLNSPSVPVNRIPMDKLGLKYSDEQNTAANTITEMYLQGEGKTLPLHSREDYISRMGNIITYSAWQHFYNSQYHEAQALLNKLESANAVTQDDYLLKAKLYRAMYVTDESNYEALKYLKMCREIGQTKNVDIFKEEGLIYTRLNQKEKAREAFLEYRKGLEELGSRGEKDNAELQWVNNLLERTSSITTN